MTFRVSSKMIAIITLTVLFHTTLSSGILDFEYTEYTQGLNQNSHQHADFNNFKPVEIPASKLQFPDACSILDLLNEPIKEKQDHALSTDIDAHLNDMKEKFLKLLTLTQKLANS